MASSVATPDTRHAARVESERKSVAQLTTDELTAAPWLRRWVFLAVAVLTVVTVVTPFLEDMPAFHRRAVPLAAAAIFVMWALDLALGGRSWSRRLLITVAVLANLWLTAIGHISNNYLVLSLLIAWVTVSGARSEGVVALVLSLLTLIFAALVGSPAPGQVAWAVLTSWSAGAVGVWLMGLLFVRQTGLVAELQRLASENATLNAQAQQAAVLEERQRLARELHDSVTQALYGISLQAEAGARALAVGASGPASTSFSEIRDTTQEAQTEMRLLLYELRPPVLDDQGLEAALQARLRSVEARAGLAISLECDGCQGLSAQTEQELYRIAQEALNNVVKHARATHVSVTLSCTTGQAVLEIADDGLGFEPGMSDNGGQGLRNMRERAQSLHGSVAISKGAGGGTRVRVEVPR